MILHTTARCIADPPCEWVGNTDKSAEKHGRETGHATVVETIPMRGEGDECGMLEESEKDGPRLVTEGLTPRSSRGAEMNDTASAPGGGA